MVIMLVCSSGASSGYMVRNMKIAAKERGLNDFEIFARSEFDVDSYIDSIDVMLLGPHLKHQEDDLRTLGKEYGVPVKCLSHQTYGTMNGNEALDEAIKLGEERIK